MPGTHLHIDPFSGVAGDMLLGALLDLTVGRGDSPLCPLVELEERLRPMGLDGEFEITAERTQRCGVGGLDVKVRTKEGHHHRHRQDLLGFAEMLGLSDRGHARAVAAIDALAAAEARVHGTTIDEVHFHEVGAIDSIVDLLGVVVALEEIGVDTLSCGPLPVGHGFVKCAHGLMPVPAPATAYLCEGLPTFGVDREGELVTPTGAALVSTLCTHFGPPPAMTTRATGYGAGDRDHPTVPNLLRVVLGEAAVPQEKSSHSHSHTHSHSHAEAHAHAHTHEHPHEDHHHAANPAPAPGAPAGGG